MSPVQRNTGVGFLTGWFGFNAIMLWLALIGTTAPSNSATAYEFNAADASGESAQLVERESPQQRGRFRGADRGVYKSRVTPHWFQDNTLFWYRNDLKDQTKEFILVDVEKGTRELAFDHEKLAAALSKATGEEFKADKLPFSEIEFVDAGKAVQFEAAGKTWKYDLNSYECSPAPENSGSQSASAGQSQNDTQSGGRRGRGFGRRGGGRSSTVSPDGKWNAVIKDQNVYVRPQQDDSEHQQAAEVQLSKDGEEGNAYGRLEWSPDSKFLLAWQIEPGDRKEVYLIRSSPPGGGRAQLQTRPYALPGDKFTKYELNIFEVAGRTQTKPDVDRFEHEWLTPVIHWEHDGRHFEYQQEDRGHQRFRVIEVNPQTGSVRNVIDEKTKTFIWTAHMEGPERLGIRIVTYLENSDEIIYASEHDGWRHLYLVDPTKNRTGPLASPNVSEGEGETDLEAVAMKQITKGDWVVRGIESIDEDKRQIWFLASGMNPDQDPYFIHYYRINFDGTGLVTLTEGNGTHTVEFSPDRKYIIDTYSRVDMPPVNELRRTSDGKLVCKLEETDISELKATGWEPPEVFVVKGRDGKTDIWGIICRPHDLDPNKKYPILEDIYAGPQDSYTPKSFGSRNRYQAYNDRGFVVVKLDGMGTANRSKAFHDVCWHNLKDGGFLDRIPWIKAAAAKYPYMDIDRVGIFGTSAGGQNAAAAVIFHPEFYRVAVANSGCHDNRMDKASWNEQWMGYMPPDKIWNDDPDNWYSQCSNTDNAPKLGGKLFVIVGEMDTNVPPENTMRFVNALIRARKDFDMLVVPGANHGAGSPITSRRTMDFFVHNLLHEEPPNRNASGSNDDNNEGG